MDADPVWYEPPSSEALPLRTTPRLASWEAADHPEQRALRDALDHVEGVARPRLAEVDDPLAVGLDVRLGDDVDLLRERDLDNYALPVVTHLTRTSGRTIRSVHVTKSHGTRSSLRLETARPRRDSVDGQVHRIRTTASAEAVEYKQQVDEQLSGANLLLPPGPVALELAFVVGPRRTWTNLWKPTIDALGRLLGPSSPPRPWHPDDGRVVSLALHHDVDPTLGHDVRIALRAGPARSGSPVAAPS